MLSRDGCDVLIVLQHCQAHCYCEPYPCLLQAQLTCPAADGIVGRLHYSGSGWRGAVVPYFRKSVAGHWYVIW